METIASNSDEKEILEKLREIKNALTSVTGVFQETNRGEIKTAVSKTVGAGSTLSIVNCNGSIDISLLVISLLDISFCNGKIDRYRVKKYIDKNFDHAIPVISGTAPIAFDPVHNFYVILVKVFLSISFLISFFSDFRAECGRRGGGRLL